VLLVVVAVDPVRMRVALAVEDVEAATTRRRRRGGAG
jgi:hypothetical protein